MEILRRTRDWNTWWEPFHELLTKDRNYRLLIVGKPGKGEKYWSEFNADIAASGVGDRLIAKIEYVPDEETELYFKAADVLILPYTHVFQSGVLFLGYSFGLPAIAADVGSLKEEIIEGRNWLCFQATGLIRSGPQDSPLLSRASYSAISKPGGRRLRPTPTSDIPGIRWPP